MLMRVIADDHTGASDIANTIATSGGGGATAIGGSMCCPDGKAGLSIRSGSVVLTWSWGSSFATGRRSVGSR